MCKVSVGSTQLVQQVVPYYLFFPCIQISMSVRVMIWMTAMQMLSALTQMGVIPVLAMQDTVEMDTPVQVSSIHCQFWGSIWGAQPRPLYFLFPTKFYKLHIHHVWLSLLQSGQECELEYLCIFTHWNFHWDILIYSSMVCMPHTNTQHTCKCRTTWKILQKCYSVVASGIK